MNERIGLSYYERRNLRLMVSRLSRERLKRETFATCETCHEEFPPVTKGRPKKYCSKPCRDKASKRRLSAREAHENPLVRA